MIIVADQLGDHRAAVLELDALAATHYDAFVFDDAARARRVRELLLDSGDAEFAPPGLRLVVSEGECIGMLAVLSARELQRRRIANALLLRRARDILKNDERRRMGAASTVLLRPGDTDCYLARIAVAPAAQRRGVGALLVRDFLDEARSAGAAHGVLAVAADNDRAIAFYRRFGFIETAAPVAHDPPSGRTLAYVHLAVPIAASTGAARRESVEAREVR
jgi:ribosomal protein S18 acetylase RimI-like enzyme